MGRILMYSVVSCNVSGLVWLTELGGSAAWLLAANGPNPTRDIQSQRLVRSGWEIKRSFGDDLLSQGIAPQVPSALTSLTAGFGMGPGVSSSLKSPKDLIKQDRVVKTTE